MATTIEQFRKQEAERQEQFERRHQQMVDKHRAETEEGMRVVLRNTRKATAREYNAWIRRFVGLGGRPTHSYDYPFPADTPRASRVYIATHNFELLPLCGADSVKILVPHGVTVLFKGGDRGHNTLIFDDGTYDGLSVSIYSDT